jgi:CMP-N-acetylneuraminic acid synthetase
MTKKIVAIIPARGGSKGLPRKNIIDLAGKPLIAWTIEASLNSKYITTTVVSSDDDEILEIANNFGVDSIKRPNSLATDASLSESVVRHAIDTLEASGKVFDYIILLQPTSPLRNNSDIDNSFDYFFKTPATSLISVNEIENKILKAFVVFDNNYIKSISNKKYPFMRRQDLPKTVISNGAIYIVNVNTFKEESKFLTDKTLHYVMSKNRSIDIDSLQDLIECRRILDTN